MFFGGIFVLREYLNILEGPGGWKYWPRLYLAVVVFGLGVWCLFI